MATDTFPTSVSITKVCLGERTGVHKTLLNGEVISEYHWRVRCFVYIVTKTRITRGYTAEPTCTASGDFTAFSGSITLGNGTSISLKFRDAEGTMITQRASRKNEAGFWELEQTEETRQGAYLVEV